MDLKQGLTVLMRLAARRPDKVWQLERALAGRLGRLAPAATAALSREAVDIDGAAAWPQVAAALGTLAIVLDGLGKQDEALAAVRESAAIYRRLIEAGDDGFRIELAVAEHNETCMRAASSEPQKLVAVGKDIDGPSSPSPASADRARAR